MADETPPPPRIQSPLDDVNDDFHGAYDTARGVAEEAVPVLILLGDSLVAHVRGRRNEVLVTPRRVHAIKSVAHAPVALFAALYLTGDKPLDDATRRRLHALREHAAASLETLTTDVGDAEALGVARPLLESTLALIEQAVADGRASRSSLTAFARCCGPALLRLTDLATGIQLDALHESVEEILAAMTPAERAAFEVVVAGAHQARERSLAMQYFARRLGEEPHQEVRVAYAESLTDEPAALALVGTRRLDRAIAGAFFGDERRLQRDLLGDAAAARLRASAIQTPPGP